MPWWKTASIYHIFIDRFHGKPRGNPHKPEFYGGTLKGITEKLDYIKNLGFDTIWISPFYTTSDYHGYSVENFYDVEERFGSQEDLIELIKETHKRGMKIVADFVPNHCSENHPFFKDAKNNKLSKYRHWFYFEKWPDKYLCYFHYKNLPKINLDNEDARQHIIDAALKWLGLGLDGYRLDHAIGPTHRFWKSFRKQVKNAFPNAFLFGEAWLTKIELKDVKTIHLRNKYLKWALGTSQDSVMQEYTYELDGCIDFTFHSIMAAFAIDRITLDQAKEQIIKHYKKFPDHFALVSFLSSHDMDRYLQYADEGEARQAFTLQSQFQQPLVVYYGEEVGMKQQHSMHSQQHHGDLFVRQPMDWNKEPYGHIKQILEHRSKTFKK